MPTSTDDSDVVLKKKVTTHTSPASGITKLTLTAEDTDIVP
jgi:hypothetical protein